MLRLKPALEATVSSGEFLGLKLSKAVVTKAVDFIKDKQGHVESVVLCTLLLVSCTPSVVLGGPLGTGVQFVLSYFIRRTDLTLDWSTWAFESNEHWAPQVCASLTYGRCANI